MRDCGDTVGWKPQQRVNNTMIKLHVIVFIAEAVRYYGVLYNSKPFFADTNGDSGRTYEQQA